MKKLFILWGIMATVSLGLGIGMVCVAVHFISKFW